MAPDLMRRPAAAGGLLLALLLAAAMPRVRAIPNGACIIEIPVTGSLGVEGTVTYSTQVEDNSGAMRTMSIKVPIKGGTTAPKGAVTGIIPIVFPSGTVCKFANTATNKKDPGNKALTAALAGAKIGTDKAPQYKLNVAKVVGNAVQGNPDGGDYIMTDYTLDNVTMDFDLTASGALKPGPSKTYKAAAGFRTGTMDVEVEFQRFGYGDSVSLDVDVPNDLKISKITGCKVTVKAGAATLSCANLAVSVTYDVSGDTGSVSGSISAKLLLKGATLSGSAKLETAKVYVAGG